MSLILSRIQYDDYTIKKIFNNQVGPSITKTNKLSLSTFDINDPFIRLSRMFYEKSTKYFNDYIQYTIKFGKILNDNLIELNFSNNKYEANKILNNTRIELDNLELFCKSFPFIYESNESKYLDLLEITFNEIKKEFTNFSMNDYIINDNSKMSNFQINWQKRLIELNKLRNNSSDHVIASSSSRRVLDSITSGFMLLFNSKPKSLIENEHENIDNNTIQMKSASELTSEIDTKNEYLKKNNLSILNHDSINLFEID